MDIPEGLIEGIEHAVGQGYKFYVYASPEDEEEVIIKKVKHVVAQTSVNDCVFEVIRHKYIPSDRLIFTVLPLYKLFCYN